MSEPSGDGPCLTIVWRGEKPGSVSYRGFFFPREGQSDRDAQDEAFEWFVSRQAIVLSMEWAWGSIPAVVTKKRRMVLGNG